MLNYIREIFCQMRRFLSKIHQRIVLIKTNHSKNLVISSKIVLLISNHINIATIIPPWSVPSCVVAVRVARAHVQVHVCLLSVNEIKMPTKIGSLKGAFSFRLSIGVST